MFKLPRLTLHDMSSWEKQLTNTEKLVYLRNVIKGGAARHIIEGLSAQQEWRYDTVHTAFRTRCTHSYHLTRIEAGKICFELLKIHLTSIVHFGLHRLIPVLHRSLSMQTKMADNL